MSVWVGVSMGECQDIGDCQGMGECQYEWCQYGSV